MNETSAEHPQPPERRRRWPLVLAALFVPLLVLLLGPRPRVEAPTSGSVLPEDLTVYLERAEARFDDVRPGCERRIVWAQPDAPARTPLALVYLHGFSATRQETAPLTERLAKALGANLYEARLTGHGRSGDAMAEGSASAWLRDGAEALAIGRRLGERVVVIGCSTGGTLATWLAANGHDADLAALVLISPNFGVHDERAGLLSMPWGTQLTHLLVGEYRSWTPINERQGAYWTTRYPSRVLPEMQALVDAANACEFSRVRVPTLVVYAQGDRVVDPAKIEARFALFGAERKRLWLFEGAEDPGQHVLAGDVLSPGSTDAMVDGILKFVRAP